jgi:hypothetical protein
VGGHRNIAIRLIAVLTIVGLALSGCEGEGKRPLVQAQFCLTQEHDALQLKREFETIAHDEGMDLFQRGDSPQQLNTPVTLKYNGYPRPFPRGIEMAVSSSDDQEGFDATVSGNPTNQVMMGFSPGRDARIATAFARRVIARLRHNWDVHLVSGEVGMFPLTNCTSGTTRSNATH